MNHTPAWYNTDWLPAVDPYLENVVWQYQPPIHQTLWLYHPEEDLYQFGIVDQYGSPTQSN